MPTVIITCAVTGGDDSVLKKHPRIPKTPNEIAEACLAAAEAGAAMVHIHVRDPETGMPSNETELYGRAFEQVRASNKEVIVNLTAGMDGEIVLKRTFPPELDPATTLTSAEERVRHVVELKPDVASLDCGVFGDGEFIYVTTMPDLQYMAEAMRSAGVKPEIECFELGHVANGLQLIKNGFIDDPPLFQVCLGTSGGAPATASSLQAMVSHLPPNAVWQAFGVGAQEMPVVALAAASGGHVRVGLEDNIYLRKGVLADNQDLVRNAAEIIERLGYKVATPAEARETFGLRSVS